MLPPPITITSNALNHIKNLLNQANTNYYGIRVGVKPGGCSKFSYYIEYAKEKNKFDEIVTHNDINVLIDPKALFYILGTTMDYAQDQFKSGFVFINPNEKNRCGCGKSFST